MSKFDQIPVLKQLSQFFAAALHVFDNLTGSLGWSIILLTIAFRVVVLPLSIKQTKSMIAMQKLQPQLKEIQKKYKDDREKMGQEMMKLYKENKVSPLGGCLPLLIQLPILFALFAVLHNTAKYVTWIKNISHYGFLGIKNIVATGAIMWSGGKITIYDAAAKNHQKVIHGLGGEYAAVIILILLTVITGYISTKMMTTDPKQSKMMAFMPVLFGVFAWILPAGITIYIIVTNVLTIAQQYFQLSREGFYEERKSQREKEGEPAGFVEKYRYRSGKYWSKVLVALKLRPPEKPGAKKAGPKAKDAKPAQGAETGGTKKPPAGKKPAAKKPSSGQKGQSQPAKKPEGKKPSIKPPAKKGGTKSYPAKKQSPKKK
jgi:YidC/Oxa1 family membrane protein insertase